jgi:hypothetical protein
MSKSGFRVSVVVLALALAVSMVSPGRAAQRAAAAPQPAPHSLLDRLVEGLPSGLLRLLGLPAPIAGGASGAHVTKGATGAARVLAAPTSTATSGDAGSSPTSGAWIDPNG